MRKPKPIPPREKLQFAFVVDGECEFWYLQMLKRNEKALRVDLKPEIPQKKKLVDQFDKVLELSAHYDKVFWIVDLDVIVDESNKEKKGKTTSVQEFERYCDTIKRKHPKIIVIINNPCFEYWILLHFESTSKYFENYDKVVSRLKRYLPFYKKSQAFYTKQDNDLYLQLRPLLPQAIKNAERLDKFDFRNSVSGISQMHLFFNTEQIKRCLGLL